MSIMNSIDPRHSAGVESRLARETRLRQRPSRDFILKRDKMKKFSLYMAEEELAMLEAARQKFIDEVGVNISRNKYINTLLFHLVKENGELEAKDNNIMSDHNKRTGQQQVDVFANISSEATKDNIVMEEREAKRERQQEPDEVSKSSRRSNDPLDW